MILVISGVSVEACVHHVDVEVGVSIYMCVVWGPFVSPTICFHQLGIQTVTAIARIVQNEVARAWHAE
jgi:hypothetical protein